jgi:hypothetical protein
MFVLILLAAGTYFWLSKHKTTKIEKIVDGPAAAEKAALGGVEAAPENEAGNSSDHPVV